MHQYFRDWRFKHPRPADLKASLEPAPPAGERIQHLLSSGTDGLLPNEIPARGYLVCPGHYRRCFSKSQAATRANMVLFTPWAFGVNAYDKFQWVPVRRQLRKFGPRSSAFQFLAAPLYGFGSKNSLVQLSSIKQFLFKRFFPQDRPGYPGSVFRRASLLTARRIDFPAGPENFAGTAAYPE